MYEQFFNFSQAPFSIAPNPRYIYLSAQHREALAHLLYGIGSGGGFVALTGEVGTGKTTLCRCLLEQLPEDVDIALIFNPRLNARQLLASLCDELRIPLPEQRASIKQLIDLLNHHLLEAHARGRRTIVLIDEAQNLSYDVLEQIRLLTNLETNETKLLQIILVGQPELQGMLERQNLRQLAQRITARYHLRPLSLDDTAAYINHRLAISGVVKPLFDRRAVTTIYRLSGGIPRLINLICDRALLGAYTLGKPEVDAAIVRKAAGEVLPTPARNRGFSVTRGAAAAAVLLAGAGLATILLPPVPDTFVPTPRAAASKPPPATTIAAKASETGTAGPTLAPLALHAAIPASPTPTPPGPASGTEPTPTATPLPLSQRLADPRLSRRTAFESLFLRWNLKSSGDFGEECQFARQNALRCLVYKGNWPQLRSLDHPAVLELNLPDGNKRYVTLIQANGDRLRLDLSGTALEADLNDLLPYWRGDSILVWKPPFDSASAELGDRSETVRWLRTKLDARAAPGQENLFDEPLKSRVVAFQLKNGLTPDGKAGAQTLIRLLQRDARADGPGLGQNGG
jgi:general secretion pathway protein A